MNIETLKNLIGLMESGGRYYAVNSSTGALGRYQFLPSTLTALQFKYNLPPWLNDYNFLNSPAMQEIYFEAHINDLTTFIENNGLKRFIGSRVRGSKRFRDIDARLNMYGLLAGAHLAGTGNLSRYFITGFNPDDGQTSLTDYLAYFSKQTGGLNVLFADTGYLIPVVILAFISLMTYYKD